MKERKYYIIYDEKADINYIYLLFFISIAEYNPETQRYDIVRYKSIQKLADRINEICGNNSISTSTLNRLLDKVDQYKGYLEFDRKNKIIKINNDIKAKKRFVYITYDEAKFFMQQNSNPLFRYYLYHKYWCGFRKDKSHDSTLRQILIDLGYKGNSNKQISLLSDYNKILSDNGYLLINKYRDDLGNERNKYAINPLYIFTRPKEKKE